VVDGSDETAGNWNTSRIWSGEQTDYGLNLKSNENVRC